MSKLIFLLKNAHFAIGRLIRLNALKMLDDAQKMCAWKVINKGRI